MKQIEKQIEVVYVNMEYGKTEFINKVTGKIIIKLEREYVLEGEEPEELPEEELPEVEDEKETINLIGKTAEDLENGIKVYVPAKQVEKVWDDNENSKGNRPASVKVSLTANGMDSLNGERLEEVVLSEENSWKYTFENLEKYDNLGNEINYNKKS